MMCYLLVFKKIYDVYYSISQYKYNRIHIRYTIINIIYFVFYCLGLMEKVF